MPSSKRRIYLTVSEKIETMLTRIAERDASTTATVALDLLKRALELEEDEWLLNVANERERTKIVPLSDKRMWR